MKTEKLKSRAKMINLSYILIAVLCLIEQQVNSWQMLEPASGSFSHGQTSQILQPFSASSMSSNSLNGWSNPNSNSNSNPNLNFNSIPNGQTTLNVQSLASFEQQQQQQPKAKVESTLANDSSKQTQNTILDSLVSNTLAVVANSPIGANLNSNSDSGSNSNSTSFKQDATKNVLKNILKPRKSSPIESSAKDIEQQIIQQHSRAHHQLLTPNRQKYTNQAFDSNSDGRDSSSLSSIIDNFKSGISSRSSIVKAISDNKLARTLTDVGKTIGGNKYVAGAAAASALAALGLAVSKLITPYMFGSGGFSKLSSDPMLGSGSFSNEDYLNSPNRLSNNYGQEYFASTATSPMAQFSLGLPNYYTPDRIQDPASGSSSLIDQTPSNGAYFDTAGSSIQPSYFSPILYQPNQQDGQYLYFHYRPKQQQLQPMQQKDQSAAAAANIGGTYQSFYEHAPQESSYENQSPSIGNNNNNNYADSSGSSRQQQQQQQQQDFNYSQQLPAEQMNSGDNLIPAPSNEMPAYVQPQRTPLRNSPAHANPVDAFVQNPPRRSGTVSLKLAHSDRARLSKLSDRFEVKYARPTIVKQSNYISSNWPMESKSIQADRLGKSAAAAAAFNGNQPLEMTAGQMVASAPMDRHEGQSLSLQATLNRLGKAKSGQQSSSQSLEAYRQASPWKSIQQFDASSRMNSLGHQQEATTVANSNSQPDYESKQSDSLQNVAPIRLAETIRLQQQQQHRRPPTVAKSTSSIQLSDTTQVAGVANVAADANNDKGNDAIKATEADARTKSGKLTSQQPEQQPQQQQPSPQLRQQNSQPEDDRLEITAGGLSIMLPPRRLFNEDSRELNNKDDTQPQRRGQSAEATPMSQPEATQPAEVGLIVGQQDN